MRRAQPVPPATMSCPIGADRARARNARRVPISGPCCPRRGRAPRAQRVDQWVMPACMTWAVDHATCTLRGIASSITWSRTSTSHTFGTKRKLAVVHAQRTGDTQHVVEARGARGAVVIDDISWSQRNHAPHVGPVTSMRIVPSSDISASTTMTIV
jgi:hypothetical protein